MHAYIPVALLAACIHAFSSVYSKRLYVLAAHPAQVAFYSLFSTGALSIALLPFVHFRDPSGAWLDVLGAGGCFALGYVSLLRAIRIGDASFVVPLIGLKIFFIAGLSALFLAETYSPLVYAGGIGAMVGMFLLGDGRLHGNPRALTLMLFTTFCYALTDIFLVRLFRAGFGTLEVMIYLFVVSALLLVPFAAVTLRGRFDINRRFAGGLLVYGSVQLLGGVFLMWSFALAKVATMVNIVQSARGLFAVGVVWLITRAGLDGMEQLTRRQYLLRAGGAGLMTLSISLAILANR
jgi:drug/metabolite transporter (DMT)-like permease